MAGQAGAISQTGQVARAPPDKEGGRFAQHPALQVLHKLAATRFARFQFAVLAAAAPWLSKVKKRASAEDAADANVGLGQQARDCASYQHTWKG